MKEMSPNILIIEDDLAIAELVRYNLAAEGYRVAVASTGEEAEVMVDEDRFDLVVLDWMLPGLSGIELCRRLRRRDTTAAVPILMLTARGEEADRVRGLATGADDYVVKPFSVPEMTARVKALLRRAAPQRVADTLQLGDIVLDRAAHRVMRRSREVHLGPTEFRLLGVLHGELRTGPVAPAVARWRLGPRRIHRRPHRRRACRPPEEGIDARHRG